MDYSKFKVPEFKCKCGKETKSYIIDRNHNRLFLVLYICDYCKHTFKKLI